MEDIMLRLPTMRCHVFAYNGQNRLYVSVTVGFCVCARSSARARAQKMNYSTRCVALSSTAGCSLRPPNTIHSFVATAQVFRQRRLTNAVIYSNGNITFPLLRWHELALAVHTRSTHHMANAYIFRHPCCSAMSWFTASRTDCHYFWC